MKTYRHYDGQTDFENALILSGAIIYVLAVWKIIDLVQLIGFHDWICK